MAISYTNGRWKSIDKRKTHTSNEVKQRYRAKTYKQYALNLRYDTDGDLIDRIEAEKSKGFATSEAIKNLLRQ